MPWKAISSRDRLRLLIAWWIFIEWSRRYVVLSLASGLLHSACTLIHRSEIILSILFYYATYHASLQWLKSATGRRGNTSIFGSKRSHTSHFLKTQGVRGTLATAYEPTL